MFVLNIYLDLFVIETIWWSHDKVYGPHCMVQTLKKMFNKKRHHCYAWTKLHFNIHLSFTAAYSSAYIVQQTDT